MSLAARLWFWILLLVYVFMFVYLVYLWPTRPMLGPALAIAVSVVVAAIILLALHEWRSRSLLPLGRWASLAWAGFGIFALVVLSTRSHALAGGFGTPAVGCVLFNIAPGGLAWLVLRRQPS